MITSGKGTHMQNLVILRLLGASFHIGEIKLFGLLPITFLIFLNFFNVMLIFEPSYRRDRSTDFNAQYLKTRVSAKSAYLWGSKQ